MTRNIICVCLCLSFTLSLHAAEKREYLCYQFVKAPVMDGNIDNEEWRNLPQAKGFYVLKQDELATCRTSSFKAGWTPEAIWLAVRCDDPMPFSILADSKNGEDIWSDDTVELFFQPTSLAQYLQFVTNPISTRWSTKGLEHWQARATVEKDRWTLEIMIPLSLLGKTPSAGDRWLFNVARNCPSSFFERLTSWSELKGGFNDVANFADLVFKEGQPGIDDITAIEKTICVIDPKASAMTFDEAMKNGMTAMDTGIPKGGGFEAAFRLAANSTQKAQALLWVGHCGFHSNKKPSRVRAVYQQVLAIKDAPAGILAEAQHHIAMLYAREKNITAAKEIWEKTIAMPGASSVSISESLLGIANLEWDVKNYKAADLIYRRILDLQGASGTAVKTARQKMEMIKGLEDFKNVSRDVFNPSYASEPLKMADTNVLPSIGWAKPGYQEPPRVLVMCYLEGIREVAELAQRMELAPGIVPAADRENFFFDGYGEKYPDFYGAAAPGFGGSGDKKVQAAFEMALDQPTDVMILAGLNWSSIPQTVREKILKKVEGGTGLILKASHPDELLRAAMTKRIPSGLTCVYPFKGLPAFAGYPSREAWLDGIVERYQYGKGDIWMLKGYETPDYQILTPGPIGAKDDVKLVEYDYYLALIVHLIHEASGIKPLVQVKGKDSWEMARETVTPLVFQLVSEKQTNVTCVWTVRDQQNRVYSVKEQKTALKAGENEVKYEMGKMAGGEYFVDLQVKDRGKIIDFGSATLRVKSANRIASIEVGKDVGTKEKVKGIVKLVLTGERKGLMVRVQRRDNYRRVVGEQKTKVNGEEIKFALPAAKPMSAVQFVDVELKRNDEVIDRRSGSLRIRDFEEEDRHAVWPKGAGEGSYLGEYLRAGYERAGVGQVKNNFVTELLNVSEFSGQGVESFSFENPRKGWVYVGGVTERLAQGDQVWVRLGSNEDSGTILTWSEGDEEEKQKESPIRGTRALQDGNQSLQSEIRNPKSAFKREGMRYLETGKYRVYVGTKGKSRLNRLIVRTVPEIAYNPYPNYIPKDRARTAIDWDSLKKYVLRNVNLIVSPSYTRSGAETLFTKEALEWKQRGGKWFTEASVPSWHPDNDIPTVDEAFRFWALGDLEMGYVDGLICDEFTIAHLPKQQQKFEVYCQALRQISKTPAYRGKAVYPWLGLGNPYFFKSVFRQLSGIGYKLPLERYLYEEATREKAVRLIAQMYDLDMESFLELTAQPQQHIVHYFCPGIVGGFSVDVHPDVDFKVFLDMQFNYLANAPACAGLFGVGPWTCNYSDEETIRWMSQLYRHYCIEGRRDLLSKNPYELTHIKNADFAVGLKNWTITEAEKDSIKPYVFPDLARVEGRSYLGALPGADDAVSMRRSAKGPNSLMQTINNLEKGKLYSLSFYTYNLKNEELNKPHAVAVKIDKAELLRPKSSQAVMIKLNWHFVVFRAQAESTDLTISDWKDASEAGGKIGQELLYDFVQVQPYFEE